MVLRLARRPHRWKAPTRISIPKNAGTRSDVCELWPHAARETAASETIPGFNDAYKGTIEWCLEQKPDRKLQFFATILRWNDMVNPDDRKASGRKLEVTRLGRGSVCHVGYVNGVATRTQMNSRASSLTRRRAGSSAAMIGPKPPDD